MNRWRLLLLASSFSGVEVLTRDFSSVWDGSSTENFLSSRQYPFSTESYSQSVRTMWIFHFLAKLYFWPICDMWKTQIWWEYRGALKTWTFSVLKFHDNSIQSTFSMTSKTDNRQITMTIPNVPLLLNYPFLIPSVVIHLYCLHDSSMHSFRKSWLSQAHIKYLWELIHNLEDKKLIPSEIPWHFQDLTLNSMTAPNFS